MTGSKGAITIRMKLSRQLLSRWPLQRQLAPTGSTACITVLRYVQHSASSPQGGNGFYVNSAASAIVVS